MYMICRMTAQATIPHLRAAEAGGTAAIVPMNNNFLQMAGRSIESSLETVMRLPRLFLGML
jgi:hypothetical protein